ncbi:hypothetical protein PPMP20_26830 [Paraburkholderia phymatum]|uniref:Uncharacterized protein n=1 Tax=Paraburkholderia phymatum (strain DSM 17167 / CIP 108236 / LMG 21445 / STM815) TaxID=391038 RepID=B2JKZ8_PARP8|nr:hypothetical protein [Paraburkholderia phymatum]ACC72527.1 hypothetical protein Bphy_3373 [Paraburkholderia phymatum STM815]
MKTQNELLDLIADESTPLADAWQAIQDLQTRFIERIARVAIEERADVSALVISQVMQIHKPGKAVVIDPSATLIDSAQAAHLLGVSKKSMSNYASPSTRTAYNFPIEPIRDGRRVMWDRAAIEALAAERVIA